MLLSAERKCLVLSIACKKEDKEFRDQRLLITTLKPMSHFASSAPKATGLLWGRRPVSKAMLWLPSRNKLASTIVCKCFLSTNELLIFLGKKCIYLRNKSSSATPMIVHNLNKYTVEKYSFYFCSTLCCYKQLLSSASVIWKRLFFASDFY